MLQEKIIDRALNDRIVTDRSRCLRMRFNRSDCSLCTQQCRTDAISIGEDVTIEADNCSECMLCVSSCPSGCFEIPEFDFYAVIARLRKIESSVYSPVLGCGKTSRPASHLRSFCFGYLSEELLIALSAFIRNPVQLDLTGCEGCNGFISGILESRIKNIDLRTGMQVIKKIRLVKESSGLDFQDVSYDRRGFFRAIKDVTFMQAAGLLGNEEDVNKERSYSARKMPLKRDALNKALKILPDKIKSSVIANYCYSATVSDDCNNCFACVGICPTGALKTGEAGGVKKELFFNSSMCIGCGLCSNICSRESIKIINGFFGEEPFEFRLEKVENSLMNAV